MTVTGPWVDNTYVFTVSPNLLPRTDVSLSTILARVFIYFEYIGCVRLHFVSYVSSSNFHEGD